MFHLMLSSSLQHSLLASQLESWLLYLLGSIAQRTQWFGQLYIVVLPLINFNNVAIAHILDWHYSWSEAKSCARAAAGTSSTRASRLQ